MKIQLKKLNPPAYLLLLSTFWCWVCFCIPVSSEVDPFFRVGADVSPCSVALLNLFLLLLLMNHQIRCSKLQVGLPYSSSFSSICCFCCLGFLVWGGFLLLVDFVLLKLVASTTGAWNFRFWVFAGASSFGEAGTNSAVPSVVDFFSFFRLNWLFFFIFRSCRCFVWFSWFHFLWLCCFWYSWFRCLWLSVTFSSVATSSVEARVSGFDVLVYFLMVFLKLLLCSAGLPPLVLFLFCAGVVAASSTFVLLELLFPL